MTAQTKKIRITGTAGSRLSQYSDAVIESLFNRLKPAHTAIRFTYR